jgi:hypothetical protein
MCRVVGLAPGCAEAGEAVVQVTGGAGDAERQCVSASGRAQAVADPGQLSLGCLGDERSDRIRHRIHTIQR